jgi:hypothetical protein
MAKQAKRTLWVYLDFNVIVDILKDNISMADVKKLVGHSNAVFPFSLAHLEEVHNIKQSQDTPRRAAINQHLALIDSISKRQYLEKDDSDLYYKKLTWSAFEVFDKISQPDKPGELSYEDYAKAITEEQKKGIRNALGVESKTLNNVAPANIIEHLNTRFLRQHDKATFLEIIELAKQRHTPGFKWIREMDISAVFTVLDIAGYWKDSTSSSSSVAGLWDTYHCGIASYCDILITQDKRMGLKAKVAYDLFNISTKIISLE